MKVTTQDIKAVEYAIDLLEDQMRGGSESEHTESNLKALEALLSKMNKNKSGPNVLSVARCGIDVVKEQRQTAEVFRAPGDGS